MKPSRSVEKNLSEVPEEISAMNKLVAYVGVARQRVSEKLGAARLSMTSKAKVAKDKAVELASDKSVQVTAASAASGAAVVGTGGAATGMLLGGLAGAAMGVVPAIFTFGLSIPAGAALGVGSGLLLGGAVGTATGAAAGGATGYGAYTKRAELASLIDKVKARAKKSFSTGKAAGADAQAKVAAKLQAAKSKAVDTFTLVKGHVVAHTAAAREKAAVVLVSAKDQAAQTAQATKVKTLEIATDRTVQVTAASATGGAAALGAGGAAAGFAAGGAIGAAVGVVPALFTFGLSIPVFAAVGSGCGVAVGAVVGGTAGLVGGGATGYGVFTKRDAIGTSLDKTFTKVDGAAKYVKETASNSADYVRSRLVGATGGTTD